MYQVPKKLTFFASGVDAMIWTPFPAKSLFYKLLSNVLRLYSLSANIHRAYNVIFSITRQFSFQLATSTEPRCNRQ